MKIIKATGSGFFANVFDVMRHIYCCEKNGEEFYIRWGQESLYFDPQKGSNVWEYFFTQEHDDPGAGEEVGGYVNIPEKGQSFRAEMNRLLLMYMSCNDDVNRRIQRLAENMPGGKIIGVHIRYTDKLHYWVSGDPHSAKPIDLKTYVGYIDKLLDKGYNSVFLATDTTEVVDQFQRYYGDNLMYLDAPRSTGEEAIHLGMKDTSGYEKALTVLLDGFALACCDFLVRSTSNVSSFAQFQNLDLEHINVNELLSGDTREKEFGLTSVKL
jgi:hypothetical protein